MSKLQVGFWASSPDYKKMLCEAGAEDNNAIFPNVNDFIDTAWDAREREQVIKHVKSGTYAQGYRGWSICRICNQKNGSQEHTDGTYIWPEGFAHYIENHNVKPPQAFINHIIKQTKIAYFQGGGGGNEPTPKKKKYKSDKAITVQPRFVEPLFKNYDLYDVPGKHGPGAGFYQNMDKYKSIKDFIDKKRKRNKDKYKADDSYIEDTKSNRQERANKMKTRALLLYRITKCAIDFPIDEYIDPSMAAGSDENPVSSANLIGGYLDKYLPQNDFEDKPASTLDFGRDYSDDKRSLTSCKACGFAGEPGKAIYDDSLPCPQCDKGNISDSKLNKLENKYLTPTSHGLFGLPDGVDLPDEDVGDPTNINPDYGTTDSGNTLYDKISF